MEAMKNKLGIEDAEELAREEERLGKIRAREMFDSGRLDEMDPGSVPSLFEIHELLFCDVYEFAGEARTMNIARGGVQHAPIMFLAPALRALHMAPQGTFDEVVGKYVEAHTIHPFLAGNARALRIWLDVMLGAMVGKVVDWSAIDRDRYLQALEESPEDPGPLKALLQDALTDLVGNRDVYLKGIDASFAFEGFDSFEAAEV
jgi:cell filamentation protein